MDAIADTHALTDTPCKTHRLIPPNTAKSITFGNISQHFATRGNLMDARNPHGRMRGIASEGRHWMFIQ